MKVALLAPANTVHAVRWANGLAQRGLEVHLLSAHDADKEIERNVRVHRLRLSAPYAYALSALEVGAHLRRIAPALLNAHYASGYGLLARLSRFKPLLLSLWGMDVYDFPAASPLHRWLLRGNLKAATALASTSHCMARRARDTFAHPRVYITPFGVDEQRFSPGPGEVRTGRLVIGTVKTLAPKYGIDTLIEAFALLVRRMGQARDLRLEITGSGPDEAKLRRMVGALGLAERVTFHGRVPHARIPQMLHRLDIFVALSRDDSESFGVAAVEAACCERAIVVSDVDGFREVVDHERTGLIVPRDDPQAAAGAIARLVDDEAQRHELGRAARQRVLRDYTWNHSVDLMIAAYREVAGGPGRSELALAPRS